MKQDLTDTQKIGRISGLNKIEMGSQKSHSDSQIYDDVIQHRGQTGRQTDFVIRKKDHGTTNDRIWTAQKLILAKKGVRRGMRKK